MYVFRAVAIEVGEAEMTGVFIHSITLPPFGTPCSLGNRRSKKLPRDYLLCLNTATELATHKDQTPSLSSNLQPSVYVAFWYIGICR